MLAPGPETRGKAAPANPRAMHSVTKNDWRGEETGPRKDGGPEEEKIDGGRREARDDDGRAATQEKTKGREGCMKRRLN